MKVNFCLANFTFDIYCNVKFGIAAILWKADRQTWHFSQNITTDIWTQCTMGMQGSDAENWDIINDTWLYTDVCVQILETVRDCCNREGWVSLDEIISSTVSGSAGMSKEESSFWNEGNVLGMCNINSA